MTAVSERKPTMRRPRNRVKLTDLADALGLTKGTVSRALNGYPDISETTRRRVAKKADAMGYMPLSSAQSIKTGFSRALGIILRMDAHDSYRAFLANFLDGVSRSAGARGWTLTVATATSEEDENRLLHKLVAEYKADGFILPRTLRNDPRVRVLLAANVPFVLYGRTELNEPYSWVDVLGENMMADAVTRLSALGHTRIGFVNGDTRCTYADLRYHGYRDGLKDNGLVFDADIVSKDCITKQDGEAATRDLLARSEPPTAIVYAVDGAALGAYPAAKAFGLEIGKDLSVIGYDGIPDGDHVSPQLSTYKVNLFNAGERLADLLIDQVNGEEPQGLTDTVDAEFLAKGSHGIPACTSQEMARLVRAKFSNGRNQ